MLSVFGDKTKIVPNYKAINILHNKVIMQLQLTNIWWLCVIYLTLDRTMRTAPWLAGQALASNKNAAITQIVLPSSQAAQLIATNRDTILEAHGHQGEDIFIYHLG